MKPVTIIMLLILATLQVQLWGGSGSLTEVRHLRQSVTEQKQRNVELRALNSELAAEVTSLKSGVDAIEELARSELAMTGPNETFYHITELPKPIGPELPTNAPPTEPP